MTTRTTFIDQPSPVTALTNARLGTWLFLASEVMLFAALFSVYAVLRGGTPSWPHGRDVLNLPLGAINTLILIASSFAMMRGITLLRKNDFAGFRLFQGATIALALIFLGIKCFEYVTKIQAGHIPSSNVFFALYFTLTGFHALHIVAGIVVNGYLWGPGSTMWATRPKQFTGRVECASLYWNFIDIVWLVIFAVLYLL
jgi:cytochrome c oxidase subunit III